MEMYNMLLIEKKSKPEMLALEMGQADVKANIATNKMESSIVLFVPGFKKEQISLKIEKRCIIIEGIIDQSPTPLRYSEREFSVTSFRRAFEVSADFDLDLISARLEDGVLRIRISRKDSSSQIKKISIQ
jgi:HSP20 family protein